MAPSPIGHLVLVLHTHLPWVLGHGQWPHGEAWLYEAATECYLPILRLLDRLERDGGKGSITIGITPVLSEMLSSPRFQEGFLAYLEDRIRRAGSDRREFETGGDAHGGALAAAWSEFYERAKMDFVEVYNRNLIAALRRLQDVGRIEVVVSAATHGYLPLLGRDESVEAQIAVGVDNYRLHFGRRPRGIWLPECAYRPWSDWSRPVGPPRSWARPGLEEPLARRGLRYFFVDTHLVAGGAPIGTYEDRLPERLDATQESTGLSPYEPHAVRASKRKVVAVLARDPRSSVQVWSADYGYPGDGAYLEFHRKRGMNGLRYWRVTERRLPLDDKVPYDPDAARARAEAHADHFASLVQETLRSQSEATGRPGVVVAPFDTELFGHWWFEGPAWLDAVIRKLEGKVAVVTASEFLAGHRPRSTVRLPEGSWGQGGHHWVWLNDGTRWIWERVYRVEDAFLEALQAFRRKRAAVVRRILTQLAREVLLIEASDWPFLITTGAARDYAEARMKEHLTTFDRLRSILDRAKGASLSSDDEAWLASIEARDAPFPTLDLKAWTLSR